MILCNHHSPPVAGDPSGGRSGCCRRCWIRRVGSAMVGLGMPSWLKGAEADVALEYKIKAGYLLNFAKFIEWPAKAFAAPDGPFIVGVLDRGEARNIVDTIIGGLQVGSHPVQVKAAPVGGPTEGMHILFVTRAAEKSAEELRLAVGEAPTLIVGETEQFCEHGGMIGFVYDKSVIRLSLNFERATEVGLKVSAKLASVARLVKTKRSN